MAIAGDVLRRRNVRCPSSVRYARVYKFGYVCEVCVEPCRLAAKWTLSLYHPGAKNPTPNRHQNSLSRHEGSGWHRERPKLGAPDWLIHRQIQFLHVAHAAGSARYVER